MKVTIPEESCESHNEKNLSAALHLQVIINKAKDF